MAAYDRAPALVPESLLRILWSLGISFDLVALGDVVLEGETKGRHFRVRGREA